MRKTKEELDVIMQKENVSRIWSWSRINCFRTSPFEYYLRYIKHIPEDNYTSIYPNMGSISHEILEKFYTNEIKYNDMVDIFEDGWIVSYDISGLKFDRNDEVHNSEIADKYYKDLKHFFSNHIPINEKVIVEQFVKVKIGNNLFQCYLDAIYKDRDGNYNILDFKTSSIYKGEKAKDEAGQLVLYALALNQMGVPLDKIRICWQFLKYCNVTITQKNGKTKVREIERCKLGESLESNVKMWLKAMDYDDADINEYLQIMINTNSINGLPEVVQEKYKIEDCYVYIDLSQKLIDRWSQIVEDTIRIIEIAERDYEKSKDETVFYDTEESVKKISYYFSTLSGYSPSLHKPYANYLTKLEQEKNGDIFGSYFVEKEVTCSVDVDDLSWLEDI